MNKIQNTKSVFNWAGHDLHQHELVHKIGTDAILLGSWIPRILNSPDRIADIGTGTGIISLMMAMAFPEADIHATDINEKAIALARSNMVNAGYGDRVEVRAEDLLNSGGNKSVFDLVVSNPPFYSTQNPSISALKKQSKHVSGSVKEWMNGFLERVAENGHCCIIVPSNTAEEWIRSANDKQYYNTDRIDVYSFEKDPSPVRSLLHFSRHLQQPKFSKLTLYDAVNKYTAQYLKFSGIEIEGNKKSIQ